MIAPSTFVLWLATTVVAMWIVFRTQKLILVDVRSLVWTRGLPTILIQFAYGVVCAVLAWELVDGTPTLASWLFRVMGHNAIVIQRVVNSPTILSVVWVAIVGLYMVRSCSPLLYGLGELLFSIIALPVAIVSHQGVVTKGLGIATGIYVAIRGLDNIDRGLPRPLRKYWDAIFLKRTS